MPAVPPGGTSAASAVEPDPVSFGGVPPVILADLIDQDTGDFRSLLRSGDPIDAAVQYAFTVERGSGAAAQRHGHRFRALRNEDDVTPTSVEALAVEAVAPQIALGVVRIESVKIDAQAGDAADVSVRFRNLYTGRLGSVAVPLLVPG